MPVIALHKSALVIVILSMRVATCLGGFKTEFDDLNEILNFSANILTIASPSSVSWAPRNTEFGIWSVLHLELT